MTIERRVFGERVSVLPQRYGVTKERVRQIVYATTRRHIAQIEMNLLVVRMDRSVLMLAIPPAVEAEQDATSGGPRQSVHFECRNRRAG